MLCDVAKAKEIAQIIFTRYDRNRTGIIEQEESNFCLIYFRSVAQMMYDMHDALGQPNDKNDDLSGYSNVLDENLDNMVTYNDIETFVIRVLVNQEAADQNKANQKIKEQKKSVLFKQDSLNDKKSVLTRSSHSSQQIKSNLFYPIQKQPIKQKSSPLIDQKNNQQQKNDENMNAMRRLFLKYDRDQNGYISKNEVGSLLIDTYEQLGMTFSPTEDDINAWMLMNDKNEDGLVSIEEYENAILQCLKDAGIE